MEFKNTKEMENIFSQIAREAVKDITREMKYRIQDEIDEKGIGLDGEVYQGTGEFQEAWIDEVPERISSSEYKGEMHYEPSMIKTHNKDLWQHNSQIENWEDVNIDDKLPYLLFETGVPIIPNWGHNVATRPRNAWKPFINSMDKSFAKLMRDSFNKNGVKLITKNGTIKSS